MPSGCLPQAEGFFESFPPVLGDEFTGKYVLHYTNLFNSFLINFFKEKLMLLKIDLTFSRVAALVSGICLSLFL